MILVFDCETTGLPKNYQAPLDDFDNWPRVVQLAWATLDNRGEILDQRCYIVKPNGWTIPPEAIKLHGITQDLAEISGSPILDVLNSFYEFLMDGPDYIVAHNVDFDKSVIGSEFTRVWSGNPFDGLKSICTMKESTEYCGLGEGKNGHHKYPKLSELYGILFPGEVIEREHDALQDTLACARCFFELCARGVISVGSDEPMFTIPNGPAITKLAHARRALEGLKQTRQDMLNVVLRDVLYMACDKQVREMQTLVDALESDVREEGLKQYEQDRNKKPGNGREIKLFKVVTVPDETKARDWCLRNFTPALKMDYKLFDKAAISGSIPPEIATVEEQPRVQIAQDLTEFLPIVSEPADESEIPF